MLSATGSAPGRIGNDHPSIAPYETLHLRDGEIIIAAGNPRLWKQFCDAIERSDLMTDPRFATNPDRVANRTTLRAVLESAFERFTLDGLIARLEVHKVPCYRARTIAEAIADPQVVARNMLPTFSIEGAGDVATLVTPLKLSRTPAVMSLPPPSLGEHTEGVLDGLDVPLPRVRAQ